MKFKRKDELTDQKMDFVITVCFDAKESCPYFPGGKILHLAPDDPPRPTEGIKDEEETLNVSLRMRDEIKMMLENIENYLEQR